VRQGIALSPTMFNAKTDEMFKQRRENGPTIKTLIFESDVLIGYRAERKLKRN
jgi:hypothetical protein